jgi:F0F1-type ATP synthase membrane subunit b/b'
VDDNDTDDDGLLDNEEIQIGTDPKISNSNIVNFLNSKASSDQDNARSAGQTTGIDMVKANPSTYGLYSSEDMNASIANAKSQGETSVISNPSAYNLVFKSSYEQALLDANASAEQAIADAKDSAKEEGVDLVKANPKTFGLYSSTDLNASIESALSEARPATAEAIANAKAEGIEEGKALGKSEGESSVTSNPSAYNLVTQDAYDQMMNDLMSASDSNATHYTEGWFYHPSRGWMWTDLSAYPYFYDATDKDWMYFQSGNDKPKFYRYKTKTWLTVE